MKLARKKQPYKVENLSSHDFLNFKKLSKDLRILSIRDNNINWTEIVEVRVIKSEGRKIFFKNNHSDKSYLTLDSANLKRRAKTKEQYFPKVEKLNSGPRPIYKEKYADLMALC